MYNFAFLMISKYYRLGPNYRKRIVPQMVTIKKDISCVCCIDSSYFVLIGMYNGSIEVISELVLS